MKRTGVLGYYCVVKVLFTPRILFDFVFFRNFALK